MESRRVCCVIACVFAVTWAAPASASQWLYVGPGFGNDNSSCGPLGQQFCNTLQQAVTNAQSGDWISIIPNGANAGPATITKAVNIVGLIATGAYAPGVPCLTINAGANDVVSVTNFTCDQGGSTNHGIQFNSGKTLRLDNVEIHGGTGGACGIFFDPNTTAQLSASNSTINGFGTSGNGGGICISPRAGKAVQAVLDHLNLQSNFFGLRSNATTGSVKLTLANASFQGNTSKAIFSGTQSSVFVKDSTILGNAVGLSHQGGVLVSLGGNTLVGNTQNGTFTSTLPQK